jgi:hypothetical protein
MDIKNDLQKVRYIKNTKVVLDLLLVSSIVLRLQKARGIRG